jgi:hypothetical protein
MKASPQLLILEAAVGLFEERLEARPDQRRADLLLLEKQLHRLNGLYIRLIEATTEPPKRRVTGPRTSRLR